MGAVIEFSLIVPVLCACGKDLLNHGVQNVFGNDTGHGSKQCFC